MDKHEKVLDKKVVRKVVGDRPELPKWQTPVVSQLQIKRSMSGSGPFGDGDGGFTTVTPT